MALSDNLVFAQFGDSLSDDYPGNATATNPSGLTDPGVSGGDLTCDGTQGITFSYGSAIFAPGTGDFTIAVRATINTSASSGNVLVHLGTSAQFSNELMICQRDSANLSLELTEIYNISTDYAYTTDNAFVIGTPFVLVARRASGVYQLFDGAGNDITAAVVGFDASYSVSDASDVTLGAEYDASRVLDGAESWVVVWDRALTATELANNMNETDLKAAVTGGGSDTTPPTLSSPSGSTTGQTTLGGSVSSDESNGTLYWVVSTSNTSPSVAQIQAGQDSSGTAAADSGSQTVSATGTQNVSATGLTADTTYYFHFQQQDAAANDSTVVTSAAVTTNATRTGSGALAAGASTMSGSGSVVVIRRATLTLKDATGTVTRTNLSGIEYRLRESVGGSVTDDSASQGTLTSDGSGQITLAWTAGGLSAGQNGYFEIWEPVSGFYANGLVQVS